MHNWHEVQERAHMAVVAINLLMWEFLMKFWNSESLKACKSSKMHHLNESLTYLIISSTYKEHEEHFN